MGKIIPRMVFIKKFFVLLAVCCLVASCSMDENGQEFDLEFLPVISVDAPQTVTPGQTSNFRLYFRRPTDCYFVNGFDYSAQGNIRYVAVQAIVVEDSDCMSLDGSEPEYKDMPFVCPPTYDSSSYVFRFYSGTDAVLNSENYLEIEVPVVQ
jgi:hypothetical protein